MGATRFVLTAVTSGLALAAGAYGAHVAAAWLRFGHARRPSSPDDDPLLDVFMPSSHAVESHSVRVAAPADIALKAMAELDWRRPAVIRAVIRARQWMLGGADETRALPSGLLAHMKALGWGPLAEIPGREIVMGAVTQPWTPNVVFHALPPDEFARFFEPGWVKIAWTLRADPVGPAESIVRTQTRAAATDPVARSKFRWYWARFSPGILVIRHALLGPAKREAERRARLAATPAAR